MEKTMNHFKESRINGTKKKVLVHSLIVRYIFLFIFIGYLVPLVQAQVDPVTVIVSMPPPYTPFLSEYGAAGISRLQVSLIVNDSRMVNFPAKVQMIVERVNSGIVMQTGEYASIPPVMLTGGVTELLTGADLSILFQAQNNVFSGFDQTQYAQTGRIPDGQYRIGFRVTDSRRSEVILSNTAYTQPGWFILNDPPLLNLPRNKAEERINEPQNVKLEWFPRHLGSLNSAFATSYRIELFALRVPGMDPNQVALSRPPDYTDVTSQTRYYIGPDKFVLEPGVEYAWRVKAFAEDLTLFQNGGYSEVFSFVYGSLCPVPADVEAEVLGTEKALISWETNPLQTTFVMRFRASDADDAPWHEKESFVNSVEISDLLSAGRTYDYQVKAKCGNVESIYSNPASFSTDIPMASNFQCGSQDAVSITNQNPKIFLQRGDYIYNGEFPIKLTSVEGSNGVFKGTGRMRIPFLANIQVNMEFENIKVNELNEVYEGELVSVYNPVSPFLVEIHLPDSTTLAETLESPHDSSESSSGTTPTNTLTVINTPDSTTTTSSDDELQEEPDSSQVLADANETADNSEPEEDETENTQTDSDSDEPSDDSNSETDNEDNQENTNSNITFTVTPDITSVGYKQNIPVSFAVTSSVAEEEGYTIEFVPALEELKEVYTFQDIECQESVVENNGPETAGEGSTSVTLNQPIGNLTIPCTDDYVIHWIPGFESSMADPGNRTFVFNLVKDGQKVATQNITMEIIPKYTLDDIIALHKPATNNSRVAHKTKTLFLVGKGNRKINLQCKVKETGYKFWPGEPVWKINETIQDCHSKDFVYNGDVFPTLESSSEIRETKVSVQAYKQELSVDLDWLRERKRSAEVVPFDLKRNLTNLTGGFNNFVKWFNKNPAFNIQAEASISFEDYMFNEEAFQSRLYKNVRQSSINGSIEVATDDIPIPGINWKIPKVFEVGVYFQIYTGLTLSGHLTYKKLYYEENYTLASKGFGGELYGGISVGLKASILPGTSVILEAKGFAKVEVAGVFDYEIIDNADDEYSLALVLRPVILGYEIKAGYGGWELMDLTGSMYITDEYTGPCIGNACH